MRNFGTMGVLLGRLCRRQGWSDYLNQLITSSSAPHHLVSTFLPRSSVVWLCPTKQMAPSFPKRLRSCREGIQNDCHFIPYVLKIPCTDTSSRSGQRPLQVACDHTSFGALSSIIASILPQEEHSTRHGLLVVEAWLIVSLLISNA